MTVATGPRRAGRSSSTGRDRLGVLGEIADRRLADLRPDLDELDALGRR